MRIPSPVRTWFILAPVVIFALLLWPLSVRVFAVSSHIQDCTSSGDDQTCTFGVAPASTSAILVAAYALDTTTLDLTSTPGGVTETILHTATGGTKEIIIYCMPGNGSGTSFVVTTSSTANAHTGAAEFSNTSCTEDGVSVTDSKSSVSTHTVTMTTTAANSVVFGQVACTSSCNADFTHGTATTAIPSNDADIGSQTLAGWQISTTAGSYSLQWTSANGESSLLGIVAVQTAGAASGPPVGSLGLLGVGK